MTMELQLAGDPGMLPPPARTGRAARWGFIQVGVDVADGAGRAGEQRPGVREHYGVVSA